MEDLVAGDLIADRYRLGLLLGRGGMGNVWEARDVRLERTVAVKVLRAEVAEQTGVQGRFEREATMAAQVNHPNAVAVYDSGEHRGVPFLVLERLPGRTLADEEADEPLTELRVLEVGQQILGAVGAAHAAGVIHRDIKPANVLLTESGAAKVADFGIATVGEASGLTATGTVVGTATYLPPERLQGRPASPASDIYAIGVVLFEALAGRKPFPAVQPLALLHAMITADAPLVSSLRDDIAPNVDAALAWSLAREPEDRPATCAEFAQALRSPRPAGSDLPGVAAAEAVAVERGPADPDGRTTLVPLTTVGPTGRPEPVLPSRAPSDRHDRSRRTIAVLLGVVALALAVGLIVLLVSRPDGSTTGPSTTRPATTAPPTTAPPTTAPNASTSATPTSAPTTAPTTIEPTTSSTTVTTTTTTAPPSTNPPASSGETKAPKPPKGSGG